MASVSCFVCLLLKGILITDMNRLIGAPFFDSLALFSFCIGESVCCIAFLSPLGRFIASRKERRSLLECYEGNSREIIVH